MKITIRTSLILAFASLTLSLSAADSTVLAKVGDREIRAEDIRPYLEGLSETDRQALLKNPAALNQLVRTVVLQDLLYKEATQAGWEKKPEVKEQLVRLQKNAVTESYLQAVTKIPDAFPSEDEIVAVYENRKSTLQMPTRYRVAQIFVTSEAKVDGVVAALKQPGADFAAVAKTQSDEPQSAANGGEIGWVAENAVQPAIKDRLVTLKKDAISEPIKTTDGTFILKMLEISPAHQATLEEVRPQITQLLRQERARANREAYLGKVQQQNPIAINELSLASVLAATPQN